MARTALEKVPRTVATRLDTAASAADGGDRAQASASTVIPVVPPMFAQWANARSAEPAVSTEVFGQPRSPHADAGRKEMSPGTRGRRGARTWRGPRSQAVGDEREGCSEADNRIVCRGSGVGRSRTHGSVAVQTVGEVADAGGATLRKNKTSFIKALDRMLLICQVPNGKLRERCYCVLYSTVRYCTVLIHDMYSTRTGEKESPLKPIGSLDLLIGQAFVLASRRARQWCSARHRRPLSQSSKCPHE